MALNLFDKAKYFGQQAEPMSQANASGYGSGPVTGQVTATPSPDRGLPKIPQGIADWYRSGWGQTAFVPFLPFSGRDIGRGMDWYNDQADPVNAYDSAAEAAARARIEAKAREEASRARSIAGLGRDVMRETGVASSFQANDLGAYLGAMLRQNQTQMDLLSQMAGTQKGLYGRGLDLANQNSLLDYERSAFPLQRRLDTAERDKSFIQRALEGELKRLDIERRGIPLDRTDLDTQFNRAKRQLAADYTRRGAWFAPERVLSGRDLQSGYDTNVARLGLREEDIGAREQLRRLMGEKESATLEDDLALAGANLGFLGRGLDLARQGNQLTYDTNIFGVDRALLGDQFQLNRSTLDTIMGMPPEVWGSLRQTQGDGLWGSVRRMFGVP